MVRSFGVGMVWLALTVFVGLALSAGVWLGGLKAGTTPSVALVAAISTAPVALYPDEPNVVLTPGVVDTSATLSVVCGQSTSARRNVPASEKDAVYREYGLDPRHHDACEVDHLISLELGGSNDIANLWPEHYSEPWGARDKDRLENKLHAMVCAGQMTLADAQMQIRTDWIGAYQRYMPAPNPMEQ